MSTHTFSILFSTNHLLKIAARKTQLSLNSMMSGLCSVLITEWDQLGIQGWAPLPELQGQGWAGFHEQREALFACAPAI
jgi:hypothetical protein